MNDPENGFIIRYPVVTTFEKTGQTGVPGALNFCAQILPAAR